MMKKFNFLPVLIAVALTGCEGSGGSNTSEQNTVPDGVIVTAIDGYLHKAQVWVDKDGNLNNGCEVNTNSETSIDGTVEIDSQYKGLAICVKAITDRTVDTTRGIVTKGFELKAPAGNSKGPMVVNPMTNMVVKKLTADSSLLIIEAKQLVLSTINDTSKLNVDEALVFGDYLKVDSNEAAALNVIGEVLVDYIEQPISTQLEIAKKVAELTSDMIENEQPLDNLSPVVLLEDGGYPLTVSPNERPNVTNNLKAQSVEFGFALQEFSITKYFSNNDNDTLTYILISTDGSNGIAIDKTNGIITGVPEKTGVFKYQVFAHDGYSRSLPLEFILTVKSSNKEPTVNKKVRDQIQQQLSSLIFEQGQQINEAVDATNLFTDLDGDILEFTFKISTEDLFVNIDGGNLTIIGKPKTNGAVTITLTASDHINSILAQAEFTLMIQDATVEPIPEPLEPLISINPTSLLNKNLYFAESPKQSMTANYCQTFKLVGNLQSGEFYLGNDLSTTTCSSITAKASGTYTIQNNIVSIISINGDFTLTLLNEDDINHYVISRYEHNNEDEEYSAFSASEQSSIIEARLITQHRNDLGLQRETLWINDIFTQSNTGVYAHTFYIGEPEFAPGTEIDFFFEQNLNCDELISNYRGIEIDGILYDETSKGHFDGKDFPRFECRDDDEKPSTYLHILIDATFNDSQILNITVVPRDQVKHIVPIIRRNFTYKYVYSN